VDHVAATLAKMDCDAVDAFADLVYQAWQDDRQVFVFGNGGSAATASHYVTDLVKTCAVGGVRRLRAFCLVDNVPLTTALGNDMDYKEIFRYPLASYARAGDVAIAISGSGTSPNVVAACEWAKANGVTLVSLTGFGGGTIGPMADVHVNIPSDNFGAIEDLHLSIGHMVIQSLHQKLKITSTEALAS
jgi:D-sedoheptulose 7-phosphate isomerase